MSEPLTQSTVRGGTDEPLSHETIPAAYARAVKEHGGRKEDESEQHPGMEQLHVAFRLKDCLAL